MATNDITPKQANAARAAGTPIQDEVRAVLKSRLPGVVKTMVVVSALAAAVRIAGNLLLSQG